jgi:hypothetical protein
MSPAAWSTSSCGSEGPSGVLEYELQMDNSAASACGKVVAHFRGKAVATPAGEGYCNTHARL